MKKKAVMKRIREADAAALKVIRATHNRDELEAKRNSKKRKHAEVEDEEEEEEDLVNDLD